MRGQGAQTWSFRARRVYHQFLNLLYPEVRKTCVLCHRPGTLEDLGEMLRNEANTSFLGVCLLCFQELMKVPLRNDRRILATSDQRDKRQTIAVFGAVPYSGVIPQLIRSWKYDGVLDLTGWFVDKLEVRLASIDTLKIDGIIPVPTSSDRYRKRGYHQVMLLAQELAKRCKLPVVDCMIRMNQRSGSQTDSFTQSQTAKNARERLKSLAGVYGVRQGMDLRNLRLILLDDIATTGATLSVCANELYQAGVREVIGLAISTVDLRL